MWFMLAASCYVRVLQVAGYFATKKMKVPTQLNEDEIKVGGMIVELILKMQFNTHSVTEGTDAREAQKQVLAGEFENRNRSVSMTSYVVIITLLFLTELLDLESTQHMPCLTMPVIIIHTNILKATNLL